MPSGARKRKALKRKQQQATNPHPPLDSAASDPSLKANGSFHGNGNGNGNGHSEFSDNHPSTDEEFQEDLASATTTVEMESPENGKGEVNAAGTGTKEESPAAGDVDLGFTPGEVDVPDEGAPDEIGSAAAVPVVQIDSANEEVVQTCEAVAGASDAAVDAMVSESLVKVVSVVDTPAVVTSEVPTSGALSEASSEVPTADAVADASASESLVEVVSVVNTAVVVASVVAEPEPCATEIARTVVAAERVSLAPVIVHRATWWNCCGLLDVFSGSQR